MGSQVSINSKLVFVIPDIHFPHHDRKAVECMLRAHEALRPQRTVQLGDALDCGGFAFHPSNSLRDVLGHNFLKDEVDPCREFTTRCLKNTSRFIQMGGNHEHRIERRCIEWGKIGESIFGVVNPGRLLGEGRSSQEWDWVPYVPTKNPTSYYPICKTLIAVHGWSFAEQAASVHLRATRDMSVVFGHTHRKQYDSTRNPFTGQIIRAWSVGTLSRLQPLYATDGKPNNWTHGFGLVYVGSNGRDFSEYAITIENGQCTLPSGEQIKV